MCQDVEGPLSLHFMCQAASTDQLPACAGLPGASVSGHAHKGRPERPLEPPQEPGKGETTAEDTDMAISAGVHVRLPSIEQWRQKRQPLQEAVPEDEPLAPLTRQLAFQPLLKDELTTKASGGSEGAAGSNESTGQCEPGPSPFAGQASGTPFPKRRRAGPAVEPARPSASYDSSCSLPLPGDPPMQVNLTIRVASISDCFCTIIGVAMLLLEEL